MKRILWVRSCALCALCFLLALGGPAAGAAQKGTPGVSAQSAILISADDGQVLYEHNAHQQLAMASTTKIMTALLTLEEAARSDDPELTITEEMVMVEGSSMGLQAGNRLTLRNLTAGMLLASGNDAANAAALALGGSQEGFAQLMNRRAAEIGMAETNFVTPSGLDDEAHYSTAYDMALLAREALKNPEFARIAASSTLQVEFLEPAQKISYSNHNRLLKMYEGCIGVKTGYTKKAGRCLVSAARREGTTLVAVTLNAPDDWDDHMALFDYGFANFATASFHSCGLPETLPVVGGTQGETQLVPGEESAATLPLEQAQAITRRVLLPRFLYAPVTAGEQVGEVQYWLNGEALYRLPLFVGQNAPCLEPEPTGWKAFWGKVKGWFGWD